MLSTSTISLRSETSDMPEVISTMSKSSSRWSWYGTELPAWAPFRESFNFLRHTLLVAQQRLWTDSGSWCQCSISDLLFHFQTWLFPTMSGKAALHSIWTERRSCLFIVFLFSWYFAKTARVEPTGFGSNNPSAAFCFSDLILSYSSRTFSFSLMVTVLRVSASCLGKTPWSMVFLPGFRLFFPGLRARLACHCWRRLCLRKRIVLKTTVATNLDPRRPGILFDTVFHQGLD